MSETTFYTFDTSAFIQSARRTYPIGHFRGVWERFDELIFDGRLTCTMQVLEEVRKGDALATWVASSIRRNQLFIEADQAVQQAQRDLLKRYPQAVLNVRTSQWGDPWTVAYALVAGRTLVHEETRTGSPQNPSIRRMCEDLQIPQMTVLQLIKHEDWVFSRYSPEPQV